MEIISTTLTESKQTSSEYEYYLAVSSDGLYVIDKQNRLIQTIIEHKDKNAYVIACKDENHFLDTIDLLKEVIMDGYDALMFLAYWLEKDKNN